MEGERTESARGDLAGSPANLPGGSGWIKTKVAAEALGVDPRTVRAYIERGDLVAKSEGEGIQKAYLVSIDSVYALRDSRRTPTNKRRRSDAEGREKSARNASSPGAPGSSAGAPSGIPAEDLADVIRDLTAETVRMSAEAAEFKTRLELTAQAESTLRESLERERERADRLEAELLATLREPQETRDVPDSVSSTSEAIVKGTPPNPEGRETTASPPSEGRTTSWWRRFFGFD